MEAEARSILEESMLSEEPEEHLYLRARKLVDKYGPMEMELPPREFADDPPDFH